MNHLKPSTLIIVGIAYFIWPFDLPTFIDDAIVNLLCASGAFYLNYVANKMCDKAEGFDDGYTECEKIECEEIECEETECEETECENIEYKKNRIEFVDVFGEKKDGV